MGEEKIEEGTCKVCGKLTSPYVEFHNCQENRFKGSPSVLATKQYLDVGFETARALHRVVRGFHDGECPKCHKLFQSENVHSMNGDMECPNCRFRISHELAEKAMHAFAPVMERNLKLFEEWRKTVE